jgi:hypothetical protein
MNRSETWTFYADDYGKSFGRVIAPTDLVEYPRCIMSLLSDSQEVATLGDAERANDMVNGVKEMLNRMIDAARDADRAAYFAAGDAELRAISCMACGRINADSVEVLAPRVGRMCRDRLACAKRAAGPDREVRLDPAIAALGYRLEVGEATEGRSGYTLIGKRAARYTLWKDVTSGALFPISRSGKVVSVAGAAWFVVKDGILARDRS